MCEIMVHVFWECSACSGSFMVKLEEQLGDRYADFQVLNSIEEKTPYVLGSELWEQNFKSLLSLDK